MRFGPGALPLIMLCRKNYLCSFWINGEVVLVFGLPLFLKTNTSIFFLGYCFEAHIHIGVCASILVYNRAVHWKMIDSYAYIILVISSQFVTMYSLDVFKFSKLLAQLL